MRNYILAVVLGAGAILSARAEAQPEQPPDDSPADEAESPPSDAEPPPSEEVAPEDAPDSPTEEEAPSGDEDPVTPGDDEGSASEEDEDGGDIEDEGADEEPGEFDDEEPLPDTEDLGAIEEFSLEELLTGGFREADAGSSEEAEAIPGAVTSVPRARFDLWGAVNPVEALRGVPGVSTATITASQLLVGIRGTNPFDSQRIALLVDGVPLSLDFFGVRTYGQIPLAFVDVESVEVLRNPTVLYGPNAVAGAINIRSRRPTRSGFNVRLVAGENNFYWGSMSATGTLERGAFRVGFDYQRTNQWGDRQGIVGSGPMLGPPRARDAQRDGILIQERYNAGGQLWWQEGDHQFQVTLGYSSFDGRLRFPDRICEQEISISGPIISVSHSVPLEDREDGLRLTSRLTYMRPDTDMVGARRAAISIPDGSPHSLVRNEANLTMQLSGSLIEEIGGRLLVGADVSYMNTQNTAFLAQNRDQVYGGIFALPSVRLFEGMRFYFGGRVDLAFSEEFLPSPTGSLVYSFEEIHSLRLTASSAARSGNLYELGLSLPFVEDTSAGKRGYYFGDPGIQAERLSQVELAYRLNHDIASLEAGVFASTLHDQIELVEITPERVLERGFETTARDALGGAYDPMLPYLEYANQANLDILGAELGTTVRPLPGLSLWGSYTYLASQASVTSDVNQVSRRETAAARNAPAHSVSLGAAYLLQEWLPGSGISISMDWRDRTAAFVSGVLKEIPPWLTLSARVVVAFPENLGNVSIQVFNLLDNYHFQWPRHQVGRRILGSIQLNL